MTIVISLATCILCGQLGLWVIKSALQNEDESLPWAREPDIMSVTQSTDYEGMI